MKILTAGSLECNSTGSYEKKRVQININYGSIGFRFFFIPSEDTEMQPFRNSSNFWNTGVDQFQAVVKEILYALILRNFSFDEFNWWN